MIKLSSKYANMDTQVGQFVIDRNAYLVNNLLYFVILQREYCRGN